MSRLPPLPIEIPIGVVTETTARGTKGRWKDCDKIRFKQGLVEKIGGWALNDFTGSVSYAGVARQAHDWQDLAGESWLAIGTHTKLYLVNDDDLYDITPVRSSGSVVNPFSTTIGLPTVVVSHTAHGALLGDSVRFSGASAVGGLTLNGEFVITQVFTADSYQITASSNATSTAGPGGGTVTYNYDLSIGAQSNGIGTKARIWSLDNFGEDLLASPSGGALYYWDRTAGPNTRATAVSNGPSSIQRMLVSPQARHVVALGASLGSFASPGAVNKLLIRWADQEDVTDWAPVPTNAAGDIPIDRGSEIITAILSRGEIIIWTDVALHALQYVAGALTFTPRFLGSSVKIIGPNAAVDVNGVAMFMAERDFIAYDGVIRVIPCPVRNHVFDDFNFAQGDKVYASVVKQFNEVWWLYPRAASAEPDAYVKYNYKDDAWDFGSLTRTAMHDSSGYVGYPYAVEGGKLYTHEIGVDGQNSVGAPQAITAFIESGDFEIDGIGAKNAHVRALLPDFKTLAGSVAVTLKGIPEAQGAAEEITEGPFTITATTQRQTCRFKAKQLSFRIESSALGDHWRMGAWRMEARARGKRGA